MCEQGILQRRARRKYRNATEDMHKISSRPDPGTAALLFSRDSEFESVQRWRAITEIRANPDREAESDIRPLSKPTARAGVVRRPIASTPARLVADKQYYIY